MPQEVDTLTEKSSTEIGSLQGRLNTNTERLIGLIAHSRQFVYRLTGKNLVPPPSEVDAAVDPDESLTQLSVNINKQGRLLDELQEVVNELEMIG